MSDEIMSSVFRAMRLSSDLHTLHEPISEHDLLVAEARLGREMPAELRGLYAFSNGFDACDGNIHVEPALTAADFRDELEDSGWRLVEELLVFGGDGSDGHYALWYPSGTSPDRPTAVIEIGEIFEPDGYAIVGTSLSRFLRTVSAFHLSGTPASAAMDALGVPDHLRAPARMLEPFVRWSDPQLPFLEPDPYRQRLDATRISNLVADFDYGT